MAKNCSRCGGAWARRFRQCPHCGHNAVPRPEVQRQQQTAYLVGIIDTSGPAKLKGIGIYSEASPTLPGFPFKIAEMTADTFGEARALLIEEVRTSPGLAWAYRALPERERVAPAGGR